MHKRRLVHKLKILLLLSLVLLSVSFVTVFTAKANFEFYLSWTKGETYKCTQGNNGSFSHQGKLKYAWDFGIPNGTTIRASASGTVKDIEDRIQGYKKGSWGNYILIQHDEDTFTRYAHLQYGQIKVKKGDNVSQGEIIALSDNTGY